MSGLTIDDIRSELEEIAAEMCDKYCRYPRMKIPEGKDEDWLLEDGGICENCPMTRLV